jgi:thiopurine S-methyltransferase
MGLKFWLESWEEGRIPFHNMAVNMDLAYFWPAMEIQAGSTVLLPLCGKSVDMLWLKEQGLQVIGIELSELAVSQFMRENNLDYQKEQQVNLIKYVSDDISIYVADYFQLDKKALPAVDAIYDRGALVALPPNLWQPYVDTYLQWLKPSGRIFLKTVDYDQHVMEGPPYALCDKTVRELYRQCEKQQCLLHRYHYLADTDRFYLRGLREQSERAWMIQR